MTVEHRGVSRKTFLMYLLQLPFFAGFAKYLYGFEPKKLYLLNKFSVAGFYFYEGPKLLEKMKPGEKIKMKPHPENIEDEYAVELHCKDTMIGHIPRSDNKHIFRLLEQEKELIRSAREHLRSIGRNL